MKTTNILFIISLLIAFSYQNLKTKTGAKNEENLEAHTEEQLESRPDGFTLVKIDEKNVSQASPLSHNAYPATNPLHGKFSHTNQGIGMWWKVTFPVNYTFTLIRIRNRVDCCGSRLSLTKVYVSGELCGTLPHRTGEGEWFEVNCNLTGNEIKLVTTLKSSLSIQGFQAYSGVKIEHNLVKIDEKNVSQASPLSHNAYPATNPLHGKFSHTNKGVGMWWKVKFPVNYTFNKIRIRNRVDCCGQRLALTKVYVSGELCGTLPSRTGVGQWYEVTCNLTGNEIKLVTTLNAALAIQGFQAYAGARIDPSFIEIEENLEAHSEEQLESETFTATQGSIDIKTLRN